MANELIATADDLYLYALRAIDTLWDAGFYTKAIYIEEKVKAYKAARDRIKNSDLIS